MYSLWIDKTVHTGRGQQRWVACHRWTPWLSYYKRTSSWSFYCKPSSRALREGNGGDIIIRNVQLCFFHRSVKGFDVKLTQIKVPFLDTELQQQQGMPSFLFLLRGKGKMPVLCFFWIQLQFCSSLSSYNTQSRVTFQVKSSLIYSFHFLAS